MIVQADAIIDPGAMMIEPLYALVAYTAVAGAIRPNNLTVSAQEHRIENLHHVHEVNAWRFFEVAGVFAQGDHVEEKSHYEEDQL